MITGAINLRNKDNHIFNRLSPAHGQYVEIAQVETDRQYVFIAVERDVLKRSLAERFWGQKISTEEYTKLRREVLEWDLQSLLIEYDKQSSALILQRNQQAECGLYASIKDGILYLHWDPVTFYPLLDTKNMVDTVACAALLDLHLRYSSKTIFKAITHIPERAKIIIEKDNITVVRPDHIDPPKAIPLKDGADPIATFHEMIYKNISRWDFEPETVSTILSSGLDTTIITNLLAKKIQPHTLHSYGYWMMDKERQRIKEMRQETVNKLSLIDFYPKIEENFKEAYSLKAGKWWPHQTQTDFAELMLARRMETDNITLAFSGMGGDELCTLTQEERAAMSITPNRTTPGLDESSHNGFSLVKPELQQAFKADTEIAWPNGYIGFSEPYMASNIGIFFLRHGVWTANPLGNASLHMFTNFLPPEWRYKRKLSKEALTRLGYGQSFTNQTPKEGLGDTMEELMLTRDWDNFFREAAIFDLNIIQREKLIEGVKIFKETHSVNVIIKLMMAWHVELGLRSVLG